jgi:hypothetical protein
VSTPCRLREEVESATLRLAESRPYPTYNLVRLVREQVTKFEAFSSAVTHIEWPWFLAAHRARRAARLTPAP